ncbi:hypothetical protein GCM10023146_32910 [Nocardioides caricicola]
MPSAGELRSDHLSNLQRKIRQAEDAVLGEKRRQRELDAALASAQTVRQEALPPHLQNRGI